MLQLLVNNKMFNKIYDLTLNAEKGPFDVVFFYKLQLTEQQQQQQS